MQKASVEDLLSILAFSCNILILSVVEILYTVNAENVSVQAVTLNFICTVKRYEKINKIQ